MYFCNISTIPGGYFQKIKTIFEELSEHDIELQNEHNKFYPYFTTFDMESILKKTNEPSTSKVSWLNEHIPISASVASNVPNFTDPKCFINPDLGQLLNSMVQYMHELSEEASLLIKTKLDSYIKKFHDIKSRWDRLFDKLGNTEMDEEIDRERRSEESNDINVISVEYDNDEMGEIVENDPALRGGNDEEDMSLMQDNSQNVINLGAETCRQQ